ncbi:MAG TPA: hypothetical protein VE687_12795 [Stellaceae bacterium]|nr:hypothetical protein [Stellaceae bacterium]
MWANVALVRKVGSVFTSTASQHGGQETTPVNFHTTMLHHGMIVVGLPYTEPRLANMAELPLALLIAPQAWPASTVQGSQAETSSR